MRVQLKTTGVDEPVEVRLQRVEGSPAGNGFHTAVGEHKADVVIEPDMADTGAGCLKQHGEATAFYTVRRKNHIDVWLRGRVYSFEVVDQTAQRATEKAASGTAFEALTAPMPGTILKIHVKPGDAFIAHAPLVVMESMKMEMTLSAPAAGKVKEITCRVGQLVEMGQVLVRMDANDEG